MQQDAVEGLQEAAEGWLLKYINLAPSQAEALSVTLGETQKNMLATNEGLRKHIYSSTEGLPESAIRSPSTGF